MEDRLINIEIAIANLQKTVDELNEVVVKQANLIDKLSKENRLLAVMIKDNTVKPLSEETPPPHY
ncbi:MAG: SlyX family protein [Alphaproteobacteria bacterium]|nr:SlyX family protein [Alphaproteobacteria bacterium]